jgi:hypothetical protein
VFVRRWFRAPRAHALFFVAASAACGEDPSLDPRSFVAHDESSDLETAESDSAAAVTGPDSLGTPSRFDKHTVTSDEFFLAASAVDADRVQSFLERSPYDGSASWLADETVSGVRAADAIVEAARAVSMNPIMLLARMQVEQGLISKTSRPSQSTIDWAFGCGCPDGRACYEEYRGLDRQLACAAATMRRWYDGSLDGTGAWRRGAAKRSSDGYTIRPTTHSTASFYAYTPWVLEGRGGNWLVWNVTRRYTNHLADAGLLDYPFGDDAPAVSVRWESDAAGRFVFSAEAPEEVVAIELRVDGNSLGTAERSDDGGFETIDYGFTVRREGRALEARGYDARGELVAFSVGAIDTTAGAGVFVRPTGPRTWEVGMERVSSAVAAIEASADGYPLTDAVTGESKSERLAIQATFSRLGVRELVVRALDRDGDSRGTFTRTIRLR